ncbi:response regulator [Nemorincola caseinilytica]|uniref:Response regulator n=1 Tax=Nemorincola caseinilytica TaxID=2054315 RepID=A0ABP8NFE3_9BACT
MKKILVIEDNEAIRENVAEILELSGYSVLQAPNGKAGIEVAQKEIPDLIICDIMMPGVDGYGVLHILHKDEATQNIPFIFLTSKSERSDFRVAMEMGADDYITKPFAGNELLNAIESRLRKNELLKKTLNADLEGLNELRSIATSSKTLEELTEESNTNSYNKKQVIYKQGSHPHYLFYIVSGKVKTFKTHDDGKDLVIDLYNAGDFFGYIPLLENTVYKDTAEAIERCEIALVPRKEFEALLNCNPAIGRKLVALLAKNVSVKEEQLLGIAYNTLRKKVAEALVSMQKKYHTNKNQPFMVDISREELASIAGTATESLIRTLSDFKSEHLIDIQNGKVLISDEKKLANLIR